MKTFEKHIAYFFGHTLRLVLYELYVLQLVPIVRKQLQNLDIDKSLGLGLLFVQQTALKFFRGFLGKGLAHGVDGQQKIVLYSFQLVLHHLGPALPNL